MEAKRKELKQRLRKGLNPLVSLLSRLGVHPHVLSATGVFLTLVAAYFYAQGTLRLGGLVLLLAGLFDALDGDVARRTGKKSSFGALLDSSLDRISEMALFGGLIYHFRSDPLGFGTLFLALITSIMVSYLRARGEGLGASVQLGWMDRTGRYTFLILASLLLPRRWFIPAMVLFVALTGWTVVARWRVLYTRLSHTPDSPQPGEKGGSSDG